MTYLNLSITMLHLTIFIKLYYKLNNFEWKDLKYICRMKMTDYILLFEAFYQKLL